MNRFHLDTDFLVFALQRAGPERRRLLELADSSAQIHMSAQAWYEFARGPRTPEQLAVAGVLLTESGVIPLTERVATAAAVVFRSLASPRGRASDIAIGVTAVLSDACLLTRNVTDFEGIRGLELEVVSDPG